MEEDFKKAWDSYFQPRRPALTDAQILAYEKFALSNRDRAEEFIKAIQTDLDYEFKDKRVLDIESAYGGFVICAAHLGAKAYGIEILGYLHELALANAMDEKGYIKLINKDVLDKNVLIDTENEHFDLIIVNDVFEHIYDSIALFQRIRYFSHNKTIIYFAIPNGESWQGIENEGHKFQFGLSLLEPGVWPKELGAFNIYYRPIEYFQLFFQSVGYPHLYIKVDKNALVSCKEQVISKFIELEHKLKDSPFTTGFQNDHARHRFKLLKQRLEEILEQQDLVKLNIVYNHYFWVGYATSEIIPNLETKEDLVRVSFNSLHKR